MMLVPLLLALQVPAGGRPVIDPSKLAVQGAPNAIRGSWVSAQGQPFAQALRVDVLRSVPNDWDLEAGAWLTGEVHKGDVMLATIYARAVKGQPETGEGRALLDFQTGAPEWSKSVSQPFEPPAHWKRFDISFRAQHDIPAAGGNVMIRVGYGVQTLELGGLSVLDYGPSYDISKLPRMTTRYAGDEPDAAWRKAAEARIDRIRKGPLVIRVVNSAGRAVKGAHVEARLTRHAFPWGTAVAADQLFKTGPDADRYREVLLRDFNTATIENNLKWPYWETWGRADGLRAVDWLDGHGFRVRAHNVLWPGYRNLPPDLPKLANDRQALEERIDKHIVDVVGAVKGKVAEWDVVNEPFANHDLLDILGFQAMPAWFRRVHELDPKPLLVLNDYPTLDTRTSQHLEAFYKTAAALKASGAPVDAIGFQCHFGGEVVPPERLLAALDRFAKLGMKIEITEFDMNTPDEDLQKRYMRDFLTAVFSHPAISSVVQWGFWSTRHWLPSAALYGPNWKLRPHGQVYEDLIFHHWTTKAAGRTSKDGVFRTRGFYGDYQVTVNGKNPQTVRLAPGSSTLVVRS